MEADDLLCSRNARPEKALAWANGTSRRASGWAGGKAARMEDQSAPIPGERTSELGGMGNESPDDPSCSQNAHDEWMGGHPRWSCAPGTEEGMEADDLLCSRNARLEKALVGRAQWKLNKPPSLKR